MNYKAICLTASLLSAFTLPVQAIELCGDFKQGEFLIGKITDDTERIEFNRKNYPVTEDGYFIMAFGRDEPAATSFSAVYPDGKKQNYQLSIGTYDWDIQRINGVAQQKVTPDSSHDAEIKREQKDVRKSLTLMQRGDYWRDGFILPVEGRISGEFGNQRVFNGIPKSPHSGTDIAAPEGTPIKAAGNGKVILNGKDYFYTGNMVIIDHGQGLQTIYAHMKESKVKVGDEVKKGQIIGLVGHTGRATGPHLHWGASLNNVRFRPHSLLSVNNKKCQQITPTDK